MNSTSPSSSLVRIAARSPARSSAGPDVMCSVHAHLGRDDAGQRRLAQPGRPGEEQVVDRLAPAAGGLEDDAEVLLQLALTDELVERARPQARLDDVLDRRRRRPGRGTRHARRAPSSLSASRSSVGGVGVRRQVAQRVADLLGAVARARRAPRGRRRRGRAAAAAAADRVEHRDRRGGSSARRATARPSSCRRRAPGSARRRRRWPRCRPAPTGGCVARIAMASAGPTPWVAIRVWNVARSSRAAKPYSVWASSRMWWWT